MTDLVAVARALVAPGKGILAADESIQSADKRLAAHGIPADVGMRRKYRELFLGAPTVEQYLSGVIMFSETFVQTSRRRRFVPKFSCRARHRSRRKVEQGTEPFPESPDELITNGLIGLPSASPTSKTVEPCSPSGARL